MLHVLTLLSIRTSLGPQKHSMVRGYPLPPSMCKPLPSLMSNPSPWCPTLLSPMSKTLPPPPSMSKLFPLQCPNPSHFLWPTLPSPCLTPPPLRCPHPSPSSVQTLSYSYVQPLPPPYVQLYSCDIQTLPLLNKNVNKQLPFIYLPKKIIPPWWTYKRVFL